MDKNSLLYQLMAMVRLTGNSILLSLPVNIF